MAREVITREAVDAWLREGLTERAVSTDAIITDVAADRARDGGLRLVRSADAGPASDPRELAAKVRAGVIARLGSVPEGLDAAIDRVLGR